MAVPYNDDIGTGERTRVVTDVTADVDVVTLGGFGKPARAVIIGTAGTLKVTSPDDSANPQTWPALPTGYRVDCCIVTIHDIGTTAANLILIY